MDVLCTVRMCGDLTNCGSTVVTLTSPNSQFMSNTERRKEIGLPTEVLFSPFVRIRSVRMMCAHVRARKHNSHFSPRRLQARSLQAGTSLVRATSPAYFPSGPANR